VRIYAAGARLGLVDRSPSYLVRQLQDMQPGTRKRIWTDPMRAVAGELTDEEMIAIGADLASRKRWPQSSPRPGATAPPAATPWLTLTVNTG
jgi:cytochrome c553